MIIATVVEGPTDRLVLEAVLSRLIPGEHRFLRLQPPETFGELGTGWKGVRRWCEQTWRQTSSSLETLLFAVQPPIDLLVIHVDGDAAGESELQDGMVDPVAEVMQPCPPVHDTAVRLEQVIRAWLRRHTLPPQVVCAIPSQDTENWTFAALFPEDPLCASADYECLKAGRDRPCYRLTLEQYGRILQRTGGRVKKPVARYRSVAPAVADQWDVVCYVCSQARSFTDQLAAHIDGAGV
jgi:hypothetical protein